MIAATVLTPLVIERLSLFPSMLLCPFLFFCSLSLSSLTWRSSYFYPLKIDKWTRIYIQFLERETRARRLCNFNFECWLLFLGSLWLPVLHAFELRKSLVLFFWWILEKEVLFCACFMNWLVWIWEICVEN